MVDGDRFLEMHLPCWQHPSSEPGPGPLLFSHQLWHQLGLCNCGESLNLHVLSSPQNWSGSSAQVTGLNSDRIMQLPTELQCLSQPGVHLWGEVGPGLWGEMNSTVRG